MGTKDYSCADPELPLPTEFLIFGFRASIGARTIVLGALMVMTGAGLLAENKPAGLKGELLVARSRMRDPRFAETVILMISHDKAGALGLIVNRPARKVDFGELMDPLEEPPPAETEQVTIHYGGPVALNQVFVLHSTDVQLEGSESVCEGVALSQAPEMLGRIAKGKGPEHYLLIVGYSGWAPRQLEAEIALGSWLIVKPSSSQVFAKEPSKMWKRIIDKHIIRL